MKLSNFIRLYNKCRLMAIEEIAFAENYEFSIMDLVLALEDELPHKSFSVWRHSPSTIAIRRKA